MKRLPLMFSFFLVVLLCLSLVFWGRHFLKPPMRDAHSFLAKNNVEDVTGQWGRVFGLNQTAQGGSNNYRLQGVLVTQTEQNSSAIISINGKPAQTLYLNQEVIEGVRLSEVHATYITLREDGVDRRISLQSLSDPSKLAHAASNEVGIAHQQEVRLSARERRVPSLISEPLAIEFPTTRSLVREPKRDTSDLPTASYTALKVQ
jgi:hypothetical protein